MKIDAAHVSGWIGGALSAGIGCADLWKFHAVASTTDLLFIAAGLAAFGVTVAYSVVPSSAKTE